MFVENKYFYIILLILSFASGNELLFNDDNLFDNYGISVGGTTMFGCNQCGIDGNRKIDNLNRLNMSLLIKANHRINLYYYPGGGDYVGFNLPDSEVSDYYQIGTQHFIKNKTSWKLNFDFFTNFMFAEENFYEKYSVGYGISKILDSKDFQLINFNLYAYKSNDLELKDAKGWSLGLDYPMYMRVLPQDNVPSQFSYILTPQLILDISNSDDGSNNIYLNCSFDISYAF